MMKCATLRVLSLVVSCLCCSAQPTASLRFEAASVRSTSGMGIYSGGPGSSDPDRVTWGGVTLGGLIRNAYHLGFQEVTGPDWLNTQYYAVTATSPPGTSRERFRTMLANLLADRFGLTFHFTKKEIAAYDLVVAPGGPQIARAAPDATAPDAGGAMPSPAI